MKIRSLGLRLGTPDLARSIAFYRDVLGFGIELRAGGLAVLTHGPVEIQLYLDDDAAGPAVRGLFFEIEDVAGFHEQVKDRAPILWGPEVYSYGRREFSVADPDGNELIFSEPA